MPKPTKRKPLLYEGDTILFSGFLLHNYQKVFNEGRFELLSVQETPEGKILEVRKAEDDTDN